MCQVVYHSTSLDGAKAFILRCVTPDQKAITTNEVSVSHEKESCNIWRKTDDIIF